MLLSINRYIVDKPDPADRSGFNKPFEPLDVSAEELITHIKSGHAVTAQFVGNRRKSNLFAVSGFLAVDVDNGTTLAAALELPYVQNFASFVYTTASHTAEANRFRIVFELEQPISDAAEYRAALTGLIFKFGGDASCKDAARLFFGFREAEIFKFDRTLSIDEVSALARRRVIDKKAAGGFFANRNTATRTRAPFGLEQLVKTSTNELVPLSEISPLSNRSIHCPFHPDRNPSAFVVFSKSHNVGIHCASCGQTSWVSGKFEPVDFDWHATYQSQAESHFYNWSDEEVDQSLLPCRAYDGTRIWLFNSRHLPRLTILPGLTYIRSPKGSGKTEQLAKIVYQLRSEGKSVLLVGHRRLLLKNLAKRLGIPFYLDKDIRAQLDATRCLAVSLESLPVHVDPLYTTFDVVILDESEQVVSHFISTTLAPNRAHVRALLELLVQRATHVICADADIGLLTAGYFHLTRNQDHPDNLILNTYQVLDGSGTSESEPVSDIELYDDLITLLAMLEMEIREDKRCFVATNSLKQAEVIQHNLKIRCPTKSILLITSKTSSSKKVKSFTSKPASEALKYNVIICSPALSTGVDISFPRGSRGIDCVFGVFKDGITTHFEIDQQLARVRNPGSVRVFVSPRKVPLEHDPSAIYEELVRGRDAASFITHYKVSGEPVLSDNNMLELISWIFSIRRASLSNLKEHFISLKRANGWKVLRVEQRLKQEWQHKLPIDMHVVAAICDARDPTPVEMGWIMAKTVHLGLTPEAVYIQRKQEIRQRYGVNEVTPDLVVLDDDGRFQRKFENLCFLYLRQYETHQDDLNDQRNDLMSSFDWTNGIRKKGLIESLLMAANLYEVRKGFDFEREVTAQSLQKFAEVVVEKKKDLESLLAIKVPRDIHAKPNLLLRRILDAVGMKLGPKRREITNRVRADYYRIDVDHWRHVVATVGIERQLLDGQHLSMQLDIDIPESTPPGGATGDSFLALNAADIKPSIRKRR